MPADPYLVVTAFGPPQPKKRHRTRMVYPRGGKKPFMQEYPDPDTVKYETLLAGEARVAMARDRKRLLDEPVSMFVEAGYPVPPSWSQKKQERALAQMIFPTGPRDADYDNLAKVADGFNGVVWRDDKLVVMAQIFKFYTPRPFWRASIWRWFDEPFVPFEDGDDD